MKRREFLVRCLILGSALGVTGKFIDVEHLLKSLCKTTITSAAKHYYRVVVLGDPHLPVREREVKDLEKRQRILQAKNSVIDDLNDWNDVDEVVVLGDIAAQFGVKSEYDFAKQYFKRLTKPMSVVAGNHDYVYEDNFSETGKFIYANTVMRQQKLNQFKEIWGLKSLYYSHQVERYQFIYLSPDSLTSHYLTELSEEQLDWLNEQLVEYAEKPTIIFFHAPLNNTLLSYNRTINTPNFITQPEKAIDKILKNNLQIILWVSGHTHTPATNESYALTATNTYDGQVLNIHTPDMDREVIWTNSLYLYDDKIVIRTFNHATKQWEEALERTVYVDKNGHMV